jgi:hypothetical protein
VSGPNPANRLDDPGVRRSRRQQGVFIISNLIGRPRERLRPDLHALALILLAALTFLCGCDTPVEYVDVRGRITSRGVPLPEVQVIFYPEQETGGQVTRSSGLTDQEGNYRLRDDQGHNGVVARRWSVCLTDPQTRPHRRMTPRGTGDGSEARRAASRIPALYGDVAKTPFRALEIQNTTRIVNIDVGAGTVKLDSP